MNDKLILPKSPTLLGPRGIPIDTEAQSKTAALADGDDVIDQDTAKAAIRALRLLTPIARGAVDVLYRTYRTHQNQAQRRQSVSRANQVIDAAVALMGDEDEKKRGHLQVRWTDAPSHGNRRPDMDVSYASDESTTTEGAE